MCSGWGVGGLATVGSLRPRASYAEVLWTYTVPWASHILARRIAF